MNLLKKNLGIMTGGSYHSWSSTIHETSDPHFYPVYSIILSAIQESLFLILPSKKMKIEKIKLPAEVTQVVSDGTWIRSQVRPQPKHVSLCHTTGQEFPLEMKSPHKEWKFTITVQRIEGKDKYQVTLGKGVAMLNQV